MYCGNFSAENFFVVIIVFHKQNIKHYFIFFGEELPQIFP